MIKTIGQTGLNFIANKFKELKTLVDKKVDKVSGKGLSTNDYDSTAKTKVDAIPANPKYTDTTYSEATASSAGLMSAADKVKLNGLGSSDLKVEVTKGDGLTFYRYGKIVVVEIFFQISQSLTSRPSNKKEVPDNLKPSKSTYGHAMLLDSSGGHNVYKTMTLVQMYGDYSSGFVVDSKFTSSYTGMFCVGTMVYTID